MKAVLTWAFSAAILWFALLFGVTLLVTQNRDPAIVALQSALIAWGPAMGYFAAPPLTLAIVLYVVFNTLERLDLLGKFKIAGEWKPGGGVQAIIAIIIISAFAIAAVAGIGNVSSLKDIALVVVGFYFGSRGNADAQKMADSARAGAEVGAQLGTATATGSSEAIVDRPAADVRPQSGA